jgi:hypothetical protein
LDLALILHLPKIFSKEKEKEEKKKVKEKGMSTVQNV